MRIIEIYYCIFPVVCIGLAVIAILAFGYLSKSAVSILRLYTFFKIVLFPFCRKTYIYIFIHV